MPLRGGDRLYSGFRFVSDGDPIALALRAAEEIGAVTAFTLKNGRGPASGSDRDLHGLSSYLGIDAADIVFPRQIHGDSIKIVTSPQSQPGEADGLITPVPGTLLAVQTADCLPITILDPENKIAGVAHAGWRGTLLRVARKTVIKMVEEFGSDPSRLIVGMGPSIGPCCYEVDDDVLDAYREKLPAAAAHITNQTDAATTARRVNVPGIGIVHGTRIPGKRSGSASLRLNLVGINRAELEDVGVEARNIHTTGLCTACYPGLFFSYRRDRGTTGRHIAVAGFRAQERLHSSSKS